jgi:anti-anti-sigma factor
MADLAIRHVPIAGIESAVEVSLEGTVTPAGAAALREGLDRAVGDSVKFVSVVMKGLGFVSGSGIEHLGELSTTLQKRGGGLVLVGVQPKVKLVLSNLGMDGLFRHEASEEEGHRHLRTLAGGGTVPAHLVAVAGRLKGATFALADHPVLVGRDPRCTVVVRHPLAEARHAEVYRDRTGCRVKDLGTRSGTLVGGKRVADRALQAGDVLEIADAKLAFYPPGAPLPATKP